MGKRSRKEVVGHDLAGGIEVLPGFGMHHFAAASDAP